MRWNPYPSDKRESSGLRRDYKIISISQLHFWNSLTLMQVRSLKTSFLWDPPVLTFILAVHTFHTVMALEICFKREVTPQARHKYGHNSHDPPSTHALVHRPLA